MPGSADTDLLGCIDKSTIDDLICERCWVCEGVVTIVTFEFASARDSSREFSSKIRYLCVDQDTDPLVGIHILCTNLSRCFV
eukprot:scaffold2040_cov196-Alexandrium_tamarense.AAC.26